MAKIKVEVDYTISDGCEVKFNTPSNSSSIDGLIVYYPDSSGTTTSKTFIFTDAQGNTLSNFSTLFNANVLLNVTLDVTNSKAYILNSSTNGYLDNGLVFRVTTKGTGAAYTADVPNIRTLEPGVCFIMIPHLVSTKANPTLNVNSLGTKEVRRLISGSTAATTSNGGVGGVAWLSADRPVLMTYNGTYWIADVPKPNMADAYGTTPIENGGTNSTTAAGALANLGGQPKITGKAGDFVIIGEDGNVTTTTISGAEGGIF